MSNSSSAAKPATKAYSIGINNESLSSTIRQPAENVRKNINTINNGAQIHCTPVNHLFHSRGTRGTSSLSDLTRTKSDSGTEERRVLGDVGPEASLISPSSSEDSLSTTGKVMVRQNTAGIAKIATIFWNHVLLRKS